jgi:hypothetical protein
LIPSDWKGAQQLIEQLQGVKEIQIYGESLHILVESVEIQLPQIKSTLDEHNIKYHNVRQTSARMEEAFISLIKQIEE